jgi:GNAT superfamily N-acetyltransferase
MPASGNRTPVDTIRHELGHALVGQNEGLTQRGMVRHTHIDAGSNMRAAVSWDASDLYQPGTRRIKAEKLPAMVKTFMGGIAADEAFNDIPRSANRNFDFHRPGNDGSQAYQFLKDAGFNHEDSIEYMHKMIDSAKEYLTQSHVSDIIKENESVREPGLSRQYHYSSERLRQMHEESVRRGQNGKPDNAAVNGGGVENSAADDARGKGEAARADQAVSPEKVTTAEVKSDKDEDATSFNFGANEKPATKAAKPPVEPWAQAAADKAKTQGGGFTIDPHTGEAPTKGYQIEVGTENRKTLDHPTNARDIQNFRDANKALFDKHPELHIGGYGNELNISTNTHDLAAAKKVASKLDQISVWDHAKGEEVMTGGKSAQKDFPDYPMEQRLADLKGHGVTVSTTDALPGSIAENTSKVQAKNKNGKEVGHVWVDYAPKAADLAGEKTAEINHVILDEEQQGKGIGKQMYTTAIENAKAKGFSRIVSDTDRTPAADAVWKSLSKDYSVTKIGSGDTARYSLDLKGEKTPNGNISERAGMTKGIAGLAKPKK